MRGLDKPRQPVNVSPDGQTPRRFADAEDEFVAALSGRPNKVLFARTEFNQLDKAKLRQVMYAEQRSICVYCERRLAEGPSPPQVEHWRPLSKSPELAIHWKNLYLSCTTRDTCDNRKQARRLRTNTTDRELPWPVDFAYECVVGFTTAGYMYVRNDVHLDEPTRSALELAIDDQDDGERVRNAILNLNHPTLREARRVAMYAERERQGKYAPLGEDPVVRARQILNRDPLPEHVSARVAWLLASLGCGL